MKRSNAPAMAGHRQPARHDRRVRAYKHPIEPTLARRHNVPTTRHEATTHHPGSLRAWAKSFYLTLFASW